MRPGPMEQGNGRDSSRALCCTRGRPLYEDKGWPAKEECSVGGGFRALGNREAALWFEHFSGFLLREGALSTHAHTQR